MNHVSYVNESCHAFTLDLVIPPSYWVILDHVTCKQVMSHTQMNHVSGVNKCVTHSQSAWWFLPPIESCLSHVNNPYVAHVNGSGHAPTPSVVSLCLFLTCSYFMSHMCTSHVAHVNESCRTCEWAMSHIWVSHVAHMSESCHTLTISLTNLFHIYTHIYLYIYASVLLPPLFPIHTFLWHVYVCKFMCTFVNSNGFVCCGRKRVHVWTWGLHMFWCELVWLVMGWLRLVDSLKL